jgi:SAM-dependent methyltransferase
MLAPRDLPAAYAAWNERHGAPFGATGPLPWYRRPLASARARERHRGPFQYQANNTTREFEYPWAFFTAEVRPGMTALEIGGGLSGFQFALARHGCRVTNVDPGMEGETFSFPCDEASIARLNALYGTDVRLRNTTLDGAGLADESFDVAFSISVLEHVDEPALETALREAYRVLRPGGRLVMTVDLFLNAQPFADAPGSRFGTNIDLRRLVGYAPFALELGDPAQLHGFPEFRPGRILSDLERYFVGRYPTLVQCLVLRKA